MIESNSNKFQQGKFWLGIGGGKTHNKDGKTLEHVIQRVFQDIQNQTVQGSEQPDVSWFCST